jgi:hypothetical protein
MIGVFLRKTNWIANHLFVIKRKKPGLNKLISTSENHFFLSLRRKSIEIIGKCLELRITTRIIKKTRTTTKNIENQFVSSSKTRRNYYSIESKDLDKSYKIDLSKRNRQEHFEKINNSLYLPDNHLFFASIYW